jgi:hypothetical protein
LRIQAPAVVSPWAVRERPPRAASGSLLGRLARVGLAVAPLEPRAQLVVVGVLELLARHLALERGGPADVLDVHDRARVAGGVEGHQPHHGPVGAHQLELEAAVPGGDGAAELGGGGVVGGAGRVVGHHLGAGLGGLRPGGDPEALVPRRGLGAPRHAVVDTLSGLSTSGPAAA